MQTKLLIKIKKTSKGKDEWKVDIQRYWARKHRARKNTSREEKEQVLYLIINNK